MHFLSELLEKKFKEINISIPSFFHNSNLYNKGGKLIRHETTINKGGKMASYNSRCPLTKDELFLLLYVDDGALMFTNSSDAILGSSIAFTQMERMGLNMHVGKGEKKPKTEAMFFPSRETMQIWIEDNKKTSLPSTILPIIDPNAPKKNYRLKR